MKEPKQQNEMQIDLDERTTGGEPLAVVRRPHSARGKGTSTLHIHRKSYDGRNPDPEMRKRGYPSRYLHLCVWWEGQKHAWRTRGCAVEAHEIPELLVAALKFLEEEDFTTATRKPNPETIAKLLEKIPTLKVKT